MSFVRGVLLVGLLSVAACAEETTEDTPPSVSLAGADKLTADRVHNSFAGGRPSPSECDTDAEHFEVTMATRRLVASRCTADYRIAKTDRVLDDVEYRSIASAIALLGAPRSQCQMAEDLGPSRQLVVSKPAGDTGYVEDVDGCPRKDLVLVSHVPDVFAALEALAPLP